MRDTPMKHIPFSKAQEKTLTHAAQIMMISGGLGIASAAITISQAIHTAHISHLIGGFLALALALLVMIAGLDLHKVIETDVADQKYIANALERLLVVFMAKGICLAILAALVAVLMGLWFGFALYHGYH
ncbi:MAG: hypothetical protein AAFS10_14830 [Myxococcota bacterium]